MSWGDLSVTAEEVLAQAFGQDVTYRRDDNDALLTVLAIFDEEPLHGQLMDGESRGQVGTVEVSTTEPMLSIRRSALPFDPKAGHLVEIEGQRFRVSDVRPDGQAAWTLFLKKLVTRNR